MKKEVIIIETHCDFCGAKQGSGDVFFHCKIGNQDFEGCPECVNNMEDAIEFLYGEFNLGITFERTKGEKSDR